ncbi:hypothetical protein RA210_U20262 [Rubrivivax sp. A210]|nr:hypothetical protein RA210_U20262 [Rubrivivax sp. A210]
MRRTGEDEELRRRQGCRARAEDPALPPRSISMHSGGATFPGLPSHTPTAARRGPTLAVR